MASDVLTTPKSGELLRFATAGSVDDGKSTLIGRLLYDTKQIFVDQLEHIEDVSRRRGHGYVDLALLTDGLRAEREQGITIDVAYRSFVTPQESEEVFEALVRFRTVGDATCTGCVESPATTVDDVILEVAATRLTERGATRADDRISEAGMEDRKKEGYF